MNQRRPLTLAAAGTIAAALALAVAGTASAAPLDGHGLDAGRPGTGHPTASQDGTGYTTPGQDGTGYTTPGQDAGATLGPAATSPEGAVSGAAPGGLTPEQSAAGVLGGL
jgi:hypothetical protein